jgi:restriction system protein
MGAINFSRGELIGQTTELVGYKAGIALTRERSAELLSEASRQYWSGGPDEQYIRIRSEVYEELFAELMFGLGRISSKSTMPIGIALFHRYKDDGRLFPIFEAVSKARLEWMKEAVDEARRTGVRALDPEPFFRSAEELYGADGLKMALQLISGQQEEMERSPWTKIRGVEWEDQVALEDLFESERLHTQFGSFVDQRYLDFLAANFDKVDDINWRQFEGLTGEFFRRHGWHVELGPGRDDDGVDIRLRPAANIPNEPPAILVQCKRQRRNIEKVVVKSLYADVEHENARSGLIVTTSQLSPGARKVVTARGYPIQEADRNTLRQWITAMQTPNAGAFLAL